MLGDSSAVGLGVDDPAQTPGAVIATGLAALSGSAGRPAGRRRRRGPLTSTSRPRSTGSSRPARPLDVAVVMVGANDVTHRTRPAVAVRALAEAVRRLRAAGAQVVVGTCPDLGTIEPIAQPLKYLARRWSRELAAAQTIAVVEAGGRTVSLGDLLGAEFAARPHEMFSADRFHPSAAGYARAPRRCCPACATRSTCCPWRPSSGPDVRRGEGVDDVAHAAARAAAAAGTEVTGTEVGGAARGPRGRWAVLLRRPWATVPADGARTAAPDGGGRGHVDGADGGPPAGGRTDDASV